MAERYSERDERDRGWRSDERPRDWHRPDTRDDSRHAGERGFTERAGDEVRSWFGDDDAARRREFDERREHRGGWQEPRGDDWRDAAGERWQHRDFSRGRDEGRERDDWRMGQTGGDWTRRVTPGGPYGYPGGWGGSAPREWSGTSGRQSGHQFGQSNTGWQQGRFSGKGPRGYHRPDERIQEEVCEILTRHGEVDASDIEVQVTSGEVTLRGSVDSRHAKRLAEDAVEQVSGVREVHNQIRVTQHEGAQAAAGGGHGTLLGTAQESPQAGDTGQPGPPQTSQTRGMRPR